MFDLVEFPSEGALLRGRFYSRKGHSPAPCVVMAHGTSATIQMVAEDYAAVIQKAGMSVLLYDHRNFGGSGGEPRFEINPWIQARGYRDAVAYVRSRWDVDGRKIALWGDSYTAMQVLIVGAFIEGLAAIVAQIPTCGIELPPIRPGESVLETLRSIIATGDVCGTPETTTGPIPVVSSDQINAPSLLKPMQAFRWFMEYGGRHGSGWENRATRVIPPTAIPFSPYLTAPYLRVPTLMMVGRNDEMVHCNRAAQDAVYAAIAAPKSFYEIEGGHFGLLWSPGRLFEEAVGQQVKFLRDVLSL